MKFGFSKPKITTTASFVCIMTALSFAPKESLPSIQSGMNVSNSPSGSEILHEITTKGDHLREGILYRHILQGHVPSFLKNLVHISYFAKDGDGRSRKVEIDVVADYLAVGQNEDYFYVPLQPSTAAALADQFSFILPTRQLVDIIYQHSRIQLRPISNAPGRSMNGIESAFAHTTTILKDPQIQHMHGVLTSGHKKDVVLSHSLSELKDRLAIYGWHNTDGTPIQKLNHDHDFRYADYSHGVRFIARTAMIDEVAVDINLALTDKILSPLFSDEGPVDTMAYTPRWIRQILYSH